MVQTSLLLFNLALEDGWGLEKKKEALFPLASAIGG